MTTSDNSLDASNLVGSSWAMMKEVTCTRVSVPLEN